MVRLGFTLLHRFHPRKSTPASPRVRRTAGQRSGEAACQIPMVGGCLTSVGDAGRGARQRTVGRCQIGEAQVLFGGVLPARQAGDTLRDRGRHGTRHPSAATGRHPRRQIGHEAERRGEQGAGGRAGPNAGLDVDMRIVGSGGHHCPVWHPAGTSPRRRPGRAAGACLRRGPHVDIRQGVTTRPARRRPGLRGPGSGAFRRAALGSPANSGRSFPGDFTRSRARAMSPPPRCISGSPLTRHSGAFRVTLRHLHFAVGACETPIGVTSWTDGPKDPCRRFAPPIR